MIDNSGSSIYHGLQVSLRHQSKQFAGGASYTFSKNIDAGTGYYNQFDIAAQRGLSQLDQTHRLVLTGSYSPTGKYVSRFTLASVATFASGRPFEPELDASNINFQMVPGEGFNSFRPMAKVRVYGRAELLRQQTTRGIYMLQQQMGRSTRTAVDRTGATRC